MYVIDNTCISTSTVERTFSDNYETDKMGDWEKMPLTKLLDYRLRVHLSIG